jgi:hypothetical protein
VVEDEPNYFLSVCLRCFVLAMYVTENFSGSGCVVLTTFNV